MMMNIKLTAILLGGLTLLTACSDTENSQSDADTVRGLKTVLVTDQQQQTIRRFPSVLQPAQVTTLSFETPGKLGAVNLSVGQRVAEGDIIASLDRRSLEIQLEESKAATEQARVNAENSAATFERRNTLLKSGTTTRASVDDARTTMQANAAQLEQVQKQEETAEDNLAKVDLKVPFDGIINSVEVESFANVSIGTPIATFYQADAFEASFSVNYLVSQQLIVGKDVTIRLADNPSITLKGVVSELGSRADTVSSFPLVVKLSETVPELKAGMAIEVSIEFPVPTGNGYLLPLTVLPFKGQLAEGAGPNNPTKTDIYVFDEATDTIKKREVVIGGVRENQLIVIGGIEPGERIASAGVSFLRDGQKVKLLQDAIDATN